MRTILLTCCAAWFITGCATTTPGHAKPLPIADFENGSLDGWLADENWCVDDNSSDGWYSGWQGRSFAWSGYGGEPKTGRLRSKAFTLQRAGVELLVAGWADIRGNSANRWNYVTLNLANGTELDRVYAPNAVQFKAAFLNGRGHRGETVFVEAVDDAPEGSFSMLCIDALAQSDGPPFSPPPRYHARNTVSLENAFYRVEVTRENGVIARLRDKKGNLDFIREPRLAGNYKFTLPLRGEAAWQATEANYILGEQQKLSRLRRIASGLELVWGAPLTSVTGSHYDVTVTMTIRLVEDRVEFGLHVDNRTDLEIGELFYPMLGGTLGLAPDAASMPVDPRSTVLTLPGRAGMVTQSPFETFANQSWLGILGPEQHYGYPDQLSMPWMDFYQKAANRGLYFGAADLLPRFKVLHLEMFPGISGNRPNGNWPTPQELQGRPAGVRISLVHMPYQPPHRAFDAAPVIVRAHEGDAHAAARGHAARSPLALNPPKALRLWECNARTPEQFAGEAATAAKAHADALVVKTDLETWFAWSAAKPNPVLASAVAACHGAGLKLLLTLDIEPIAPSHPRYALLKDYVCLDRWGVPASQSTWRGPGATHAQQLAAAERREQLNPGAPGFRKLLIEQTGALASQGVDGVRVIRFFGRALDFNPNAGNTPDLASWTGGLETLRALRDAGRAANPGFLLITNDAFDGLAPYVDACGTKTGETEPLEATYADWPCVPEIVKP